MWGLGFAAAPFVLMAVSLSASKKPVPFSPAPGGPVRSTGRDVPNDRRANTFAGVLQEQGAEL